MSSPSPILVAVDGSPEADRALRMACRLATSLSAPLVIVTAVPPPPVFPATVTGVLPEIDLREVEAAYVALLETAAKTAKAAGVSGATTELLHGPVVVDALLSALKQRRPQMAVLGARGLSSTARLFLGSVSDAVVHHAECPVLVVRGPLPK